VGAVNATIFAALSHLPPHEQARQALDVWRDISAFDVFRSPVIGSPAIALRFAGQLRRLSGDTFTVLFDTEPLRRKANAVNDWEQLRRNISDGTTTLAVVVTSGADNRTAVFVNHAAAESRRPTMTTHLLCRRRDRTRARAGILGDTDRVPTSSHRRARRGGRLVSGWRDPPQRTRPPSTCK
jgi:hypothetical protein